MKYNEKAERTRLDARRSGFDDELTKSTDEVIVTEAIAKRRTKTMAKIGNLSSTAADREPELLEAGVTCFLLLYIAQDRITTTSAVPPMTRTACKSDIT